MGVESGIVRTHTLSLHKQPVFILEVLDGVLSEAHNNGFKKKINKAKKKQCTHKMILWYTQSNLKLQQGKEVFSICT